MSSIATKIRERIEQIPAGEPITASSLLAFGTRASVDQNLSRLAKARVIERITRGVYVKPKVSKYVGKTSPSPFKIAQALVEEEGEVIQVHGAEAARRLGLSTQVQTRPVFLTSGKGRQFRIGNLEVVLKSTARKKIAMSERPAGLALTALWHLGAANLSIEVFEALREQLEAKEFEALREARPTMPGWMADALLQFERQLNV